MKSSRARIWRSFRHFFTALIIYATAAVGASAQTAPKLLSVTPAIGETNAAPHDSVIFVFDQEMQPTPPLLSVASFVGNYQFTPSNLNSYFNASWSADHKTLTFKPSIAIGLNTAVAWTLNPAGTAVPFTSTAGVPLETTSGNYKIASNSGGNPGETCAPAPTGAYAVSKVIQYNQSGPDTVLPQSGSAAALLSAQVSNPSGGPIVTNAALTFPDNSVKNLTNTAGIFRLLQTFTNETSIDAAFPAGIYTLRFTQTNDVLHEISMALPAAPTVIPKIANYLEAQQIDATKDFTLKWNAYSPQGVGPVVRVVIVDEFANRIFLAPNPCVPRTLDPTATSIVIPAGYLRPGFVYQAQLVFAENFYNSTTDVAQMVGNGFVQRTTLFSMKAAAAGAAPIENCNLGTASAGSYSMIKEVTYKQTSAGAVNLNPGKPALFEVAVASPTAGPAVTNGSLTLPDNSQRALINQAGFYLLNDLFDTEADLEAGYPAGSYTLRFDQTGQSERVVDMTMADLPMAAPMIVNYTKAQTIDATKEFTLQWNAFTPQVPGAFINLVISDGAGQLVFLDPNPCIPRTLDPTATSVTIPTNYFRPGLTYYGQLIFGVAFYTNTDASGMIGYGSAQKITSFSLQATNGAVVNAQARFTGYRVLPNGHPQMDITGTPNGIYTIFRSGAVVNPSWNSLVPVTMSSSGTTVFEDTDATLTFPAFYRAIGN